MGGIEVSVDLVIGIAVAFFVLALVWVMVIAGLTQIVRDSRMGETHPAQEAQQPMIGSTKLENTLKSD